MVRVGLVGCGTIGSRLALTVEHALKRYAKIVALHDVDQTHAHALQRRLASHPPIVSLPILIRRSQLVIEAASAHVVGDVVSRALRQHRNVLVMSIGGLLHDHRWQRLAAQSRGTVILPSGALAGLDGVKAMAVGGRLRRVWLTSSKPPQALTEAPYVRARGLHLDRLKRPRTIFEGSAREAVKAFPQNTNVAAALALASGVSDQRVRVRVVADPTIRFNRHEIEVAGDCGRLQCRIESRPSANPKTSEVAVRSAIAALERMFASVTVGT